MFCMDLRSDETSRWKLTAAEELFDGWEKLPNSLGRWTKRRPAWREGLKCPDCAGGIRQRREYFHGQFGNVNA